MKPKVAATKHTTREKTLLFRLWRVSDDWKSGAALVRIPYLSSAKSTCMTESFSCKQSTEPL
jgi:hypothetical protein